MKLPCLLTNPNLKNKNSKKKKMRLELLFVFVGVGVCVCVCVCVCANPGDSTQGHPYACAACTLPLSFTATPRD
jgi:hypothetical protein